MLRGVISTPGIIDILPGLKITGDTPVDQRQKIVDRFQTGKDQLIVCSVQAAGVGLTMTAASNVCFMEYPWTPGALNQAIDRCHRIGQHCPVNIWYLISNDTIEENVITLIDNKEAICNLVHDGDSRSRESTLPQLIKIIKKKKVQKKKQKSDFKF